MGGTINIAQLAGLVLATMLSACVLAPADKSAPHMYLLDPEISVRSASSNPGRKVTGTLLVSEPRAQVGFDTTRMIYLLRPHQISYYALNQWADTPSRMLMRLLARTMERTELWRSVVQAGSPARADYRLDCDELVLEQRFFTKPSRLRLALRVRLIDLKQRDVLASRDFEIFEDTTTDDAYGGVIAANRATGQLLEQTASWLGTVVPQ
jgi:cholesterol transport system auxiliary component